MSCRSEGPVSLYNVNWHPRSYVELDQNGPSDLTYDAEAARFIETMGGFAVIEQVAKRCPDKLAVDDGTTRLTYAQFMRCVYALVDRIAIAAPSDAIVASLVHNTAVSPVIIMACAYLGRVLVPIDASHPLERQRAVFEEAGASTIILAKGQTVDDGFVPSSLPRILVDLSDSSESSRTRHAFDPSAPLFVSFTSGSTGRPKGLVSGGRYGCSALRQFIDMFHLNSSDVILGLASLSTAGGRDSFAALAAGATIRICDIATAGFAGVLGVMTREPVTIMSFVPSALRMILAIEGTEVAFRHLRVLDLHGERILPSDITLFRAKLPSTCHISVTMGSTEAGAVFSWFVRDEAIQGSTVPVGYLLPGRHVALLDEDGHSVEDGEVGELYVRGIMALGAWRGGRAVRGPFLPDPDDEASRIYPMGDLVRRRTDGLYEYVGRKDRKVKIHGLWADLGEVETALRMMDGVVDAAVVVAGQDDEADRLAAFIAMASGRTPPSAGTVRRVVTEETAEHMAPAQILFLPSIPRLANFKPDLVRLKAAAGAAR